ncbi:hypothetical protein [Desulfovibrio porci]|uniref:hypothetical protein n=1 Tax=Desulfovibrio porci TaxID=2605782 RepID=UPI003A8EEB88
MNAEVADDLTARTGFCPEDPIEHLYHLATALECLGESWDAEQRGLGCLMGMFGREVRACAEKLDG